LGWDRLSGAASREASTKLPISADFFDTIEINTSFYHPLNAKHCRQWIARVSGNPRFPVYRKTVAEIHARAGRG